MVLTTRVLFLAVAAAAGLLVGGDDAVGLSVWRRWDADIYLKIAEHGYSGPGSEPHSEAFLPLFPLLIRLLDAAGLPPIAAGMLVTTAASVVAIAYLQRLADADEGGGAGWRASLYLLLFPTAVFLVAPYTESLFLAGAIPAFHYARRGAWLRMAVPAAVATGTRLTGLFLLAGLAVEAWRRGGRTALPRALSALAVAGLPAVAYVAWLAAARGDALLWLSAQREGWGRTFVGPVSALRTTLSAWGTDLPGLWLTWRLEVVAAVIGVGVFAVAARRREWGYATYVGGVWAVLLSSTWYYSLPRMLLGLFPLVVFLAGWTGRAAWRHDLALAVFATLAGLGVVVFTSGAWFF